MARQERERRYISEYCMLTYPSGDFQLNVPLGEIPSELVQLYGTTLAAGYYRPSRRRVDAVAWNNEEYILIESKIRDPLEGIGRLLTYGVLAAHTPDLPFYKGQKITLHLVVPFSLEWIITATEAQGLKMIIFKPDWIDSYIQERQLYFTREYREKRDERQKMRRILGVE